MSGYILAVDPGNMTGYAHMTFTDHWDPDTVQSGQLPAHDFIYHADRWLMDKHTIIVCESFTITAETARKTAQPDAIETIGVLKFFARRSGARFELQRPGDAKGFVTNAQLRKIGLWKKNEDHARDALRHLVLGICSHGVGQQREELLQSLA